MTLTAIQIKTGENSGVGLEGEIDSGHPGKRSAIEQFGVDQAELKVSIVTAVEEGVIHVERGVASSEIDGDYLVVPEDLAMANFEMINRQRKKLLNRSFGARRS
jgi:hypothetical protein